MSLTFFTADTHFGHNMLVGKGHRPYATVPEMDADLIERWNNTVRPDDVVWHLGDFGMGGTAHYLPIVRKLHGTIHLVTGNHDKPWPGNRDSHKHQAAWMAAGFASVQAFARRRVAGQSVLLSHFPYRGDHVGEDRHTGYRLPDTGLWLLHGHVHAEWKVQEAERMLNVGVDVWDFNPVPLDAIEAIITT